MNRSKRVFCSTVVPGIIVILIFGMAGILSGCSQKTTEQVKPAIEMPAVPVSSESAAAINPVVYELLMTELMRSSEKWPLLDQNLKSKAVEGYINFLFKVKEKATIKKPAEYYVVKIDEMLQQNPKTPQNIPSLIKIQAVMDYDFDNGGDKDQLAKEILGPKLYLANKARLAATATK